MHLAAGELGPLAAWLLRRRISRDPALAREWQEIQTLWRDMKSLQTMDARPHWADPTGSAAASDRSEQSRKGIAVLLTPRIAIAACSIVSLALGGTVIASRYHLFSPVPVMGRQNCQVVLRNPGQVKLFDANGQFLGSYDKTTETAPSRISPNRGLVADLYVDDYQTVVEGHGLQPVRDVGGKLIGYAELIPYSIATRAAEEAQPAPMAQVSVAASAKPAPTRSASHLHESLVTNGWNTAFGLLSDYNGNYGWQFTGVGSVRLHLTSGKIISRATASPLSKERRSQLRHELTDAEFSARVGSGNRDNPSVPVFNITIDKKLYEFGGYTTEKFQLPDGTTLVVDVLPLDQS